VIAIRVTVPIACWRKGHAREYLETEELPPPATCYGFLLSLVGEEDRVRHRGVRVTAGLVNRPSLSVVLRTLWRIKSRRVPQGVGENARPDYQELLIGSDMVVLCDSKDEEEPSITLEERVKVALTAPEKVERFGGLSLGESTHLVDEVSLLGGSWPAARLFLQAAEGGGDLTLPVWVDHVGSAGTRYAVGELVETVSPPLRDRIPLIQSS